MPADGWSATARLLRAAPMVMVPGPELSGDTGRLSPRVTSRTPRLRLLVAALGALGAVLLTAAPASAHAVLDIDRAGGRHGGGDAARAGRPALQRGGADPAAGRSGCSPRPAASRSKRAAAGRADGQSNAVAAKLPEARQRRLHRHLAGDVGRRPPDPRRLHVHCRRRPRERRADAALVQKLLASGGGDTTVGAVYAVIRFAAFTSLVLLVGGARLRGPALAGRGRRWPAPGGSCGGRGRVAAGHHRRRHPGPGASTWPGSRSRRSSRRRCGRRCSTTGSVRCGRARRPDPRPDGRRSGVPVPHVSRERNARSRADGAAGRRWPARGRAAADTGLAGHAATQDLVPLAIVSDVLHVGAVSVWLGGLALLALAVLPRAGGRRAGGGRAPLLPGGLRRP